MNRIDTLVGLAFSSSDEPPEASLLAVDHGLDQYNLSVAPLSDVKRLASFATDRAGQIVGGAVGRTWGRCCELLQLWVEPDHRAAGVGSRLLRLFEEHAARRGCDVFYLTTLSFQAPDFYRKHGYASLAEISGYPNDIAKYLMYKGSVLMRDPTAQYHAHVYYDPGTRDSAKRLHEKLAGMHASDTVAGLLFVGELRDRNVGPHPKPQFEVHFVASALARLVPVFKDAGLTVLVHPVTDDDLADHTTLAQWIGEPLPLDESVLDPPGHNQGIARFGKSDV